MKKGSLQFILAPLAIVFMLVFSSFSEEICEHFHFGLEMRKTGFGGEEKDAQITLDRLGWVKVSCDRFYWDENIYNEKGKATRDRKITQAQKDAIWDYMQNKGMKTANFQTDIFKQLTFEEAFSEETD